MQPLVAALALGQQLRSSTKLVVLFLNPLQPQDADGSGP